MRIAYIREAYGRPATLPKPAGMVDSRAHVLVPPLLWTQETLDERTFLWTPKMTSKRSWPDDSHT